MPKAKGPNRQELQRLVKNHFDDIVDILLETPHWPKFLKTNLQYKRCSDDTDGEDQSITVIFGSDGDAWFEVRSDLKPSAPDSFKSRVSHRFRTYAGGGRSLRTRVAVMILARAIQLDEKEMSDPVFPDAA